MKLKKLLFFGVLALSVGFTSCSDDVEDSIPETDYSNGAFVLNEGNMTSGNGTLTYIDPIQGIAIDSIYYRVNGEFLGSVCQDLFIEGGKLYIVSQNGDKNGSGDFLTIANARTLKKIKGVSPAELKGKNPSHIAVVAGHVYIRTNSGIYFYTPDGSISLIAGTANAMANRMVASGNKVYAMTNDNKILVISGNQVVKSVPVSGSLSGLVKAFDGNLWVSYTAPNTIAKFDVNTDAITETKALTQDIGVGYGQVPAFGAYRNLIYFSNATTTIYQYDFTTGTSQEFVKVDSYIPNAKMNFNSLGVDPATGEVYFASIKGFGQDYKVNNTTVFAIHNYTVTKKINYENVNAFPAGVYFPASF